MSSDICFHKWYNSVALNTIFILLYTKFISLTSTTPLNFRLQCQLFFFFAPGVYRIGILNLKCLNQHFWSHNLNHSPTQSSLSHKIASLFSWWLRSKTLVHPLLHLFSHMHIQSANPIRSSLKICPESPFQLYLIQDITWIVIIGVS